MKTALVRIVQTKQATPVTKNNYLLIASVTAASKTFESCILDLLEMYSFTHDYQFGSKSKHSTDMFVFT